MVEGTSCQHRNHPGPLLEAGPAWGSCRLWSGGSCWGGLQVGPGSAQDLLEVRATRVCRGWRLGARAPSWKGCLESCFLTLNAGRTQGPVGLGACPGLEPAGLAGACRAVGPAQGLRPCRVSGLTRGSGPTGAWGRAAAQGLPARACRSGPAPGARGPPGMGRPAPPRRPGAPSRPLAPRAGPARLASGPERRGRRGRAAGQGRGGAEAGPERSPSGAGRRPGGGRGPAEDGERGAAVPGERRGRGPAEPAAAAARAAAPPAPRALEPRPREAAAPGHRGGERAARPPGGPARRPQGREASPGGAGGPPGAAPRALPSRGRAALPGEPAARSRKPSRWHLAGPTPVRESQRLKPRGPQPGLLNSHGLIPQGWNRASRHTHAEL